MTSLAYGCFIFGSLLLFGELRHAWLRRAHPARAVHTDLYTFARVACGVLAAGMLARGACLAAAPAAPWSPVAALAVGDVMTTALLSTLLMLAAQAERSCFVSTARLWRVYGALQAVLWLTCAAFVALRAVEKTRSGRGPAGAPWMRELHVARGIECLLYILAGGARAVHLFRHLEAYVVPPDRKRYLRFVWRTLATLCGLLAGVAAAQAAESAVRFDHIPVEADWITTACHALAGLYLQLAVRPLRRPPPPIATLSMVPGFSCALSSSSSSTPPTDL